MANSKISALTSATTPLVGTEILPIVQSGVTVKVANNDLRPKQIQSNTTSGVLQVAGPAAATTRVMTTPNANFSAARIDAAQTFSGVQTYLSGATAGTNSVQPVYSDNTYPNSAYPTIRFDGFGGGNAYSGAIYATEYGGITIATSNTSGGTFTSSLTLANGNPADVTVNKGNLIQGTAAKGINFTANTPAAGMTSQLLNWYEEGTWTPNQGGGLTVVGAFSSTGKYTRVGRNLTVSGTVTGATSVAVTAAGIITTNLPFTVATSGHGNVTNAALTSFAAIICTSTNITSAGAIAATGTLTFSATYFV